MKKLAAALLSLLLLFSSLPVAPVAASSTAAVIDMHGAKTYLGTASAWSKTWDADNFEEVTGDDVTYDGSVTVKSGNIEDLTLSGSDSKLTIQDGTMDAVSCSGSISITDGDIKSVDAGGDITISGGNIRHDVYSDGEVTLSKTVKISGSLEADEVTLSTGATVNVVGNIKADDRITLNKCTLKTQSLDGDSSGTLNISKYTDTLPTLNDFKEIIVKDDTTATADEKIDAEQLYITDGAEFDTSSSLELSVLTGPGTLYFRSGKLVVHDAIEGKPLLIFSNHVSRGDTAFYADSDSVSTDDVRLYDYGLEVKDDSGSEDRFVLYNAITDGITLSNQTLSLNSGNSETIKAHVEPNLSNFADGTKIVWKLHGDTSAFSKSAASDGLSCTVSVSSSASGMHKATLIAYLVDTHGDRLEDYKSDSCILSTGYSDDSTDTDDSTTESSEDITLDTTTVSILTGDRYCVLAKTSSSTAPSAMSYNSSVATVGAGTAVKGSGWDYEWLYPITGTGKGQVTINIGGQKVIANVSAGITIDTASYSMAPGGKYIIGVTAKGVGNNSIWASSSQSCVSVSYIGTSGNMLLYQISGQSAGTATVTFSITGGESVQTKVTVQNGVKAGGSSARLVALA